MIRIGSTHDHQRPGGGDLRYQRGDSWAERRAGDAPVQAAAGPPRRRRRALQASRSCSLCAASRRSRATRCDRSSRSTIQSTRSSSASPAPTIRSLPWCAARSTRTRIVPARLLIGDDRISANPKLNNVVKGWKAARHDWVIIADSNVLMPGDYIQRLLARWSPDTGIVCSPPIGSRPEFFAAEIECAFLNTYEARWQYAGDSSGYGFAQGKTMLWRREIARSGRRDRGSGGRDRRRRRRDQAHQRAGTERPPRRPAVPAAARPPAPEGRLVRARFAGRGSGGRRSRCSSLPEILTTSLFTPRGGRRRRAAFRGERRPRRRRRRRSSGTAPRPSLALAAGWPLSWRMPLAWIARDLMLPLLFAKAWTGHASSGAATR